MMADKKWCGKRYCGNTFNVSIKVMLVCSVIGNDRLNYQCLVIFLVNIGHDSMAGIMLNTTTSLCFEGSERGKYRT